MTEHAHITPRDLSDSALLFATLQGKPTFSAREFAEFTDIAALHLDEDVANEILLEVVSTGHLREIGPGVYAIAAGKDKECRKCDTRYPLPAPLECDYCGEALTDAGDNAPAQRQIWPEDLSA